MGGDVDHSGREILMSWYANSSLRFRAIAYVLDIYYLAHAILWHTTRSMKQFKLLLHTLLTQVQTTVAGEIGPRQL